MQKNRTAIEQTGSDKKKDWTFAYTKTYPTIYQSELMQQLRLHEKHETIKRIFDFEVLEACQQESTTRKLNCVDLLSAYGDSFLAIIHGMTPDEIFDAWSTEEKSLNIPNPRRLNCKTVAVDKSENALKYGKLSKIFDETLQVDINHMSSQERAVLSDCMKSADIVYSGSPGYFDLETFQFTVDCFVKSEKQFGYYIVTFNNLFVKYHKEMKRYILEHLTFVDCLGGFTRNLLPQEQENYGVSDAYNTTWVMKR